MVSSTRHATQGIAVGVLATATVSGAIAGLDQFVAAKSLTALYLLAIFPVAIGWGFWVAGIVAVSSFLTFAYFFAPPLHELGIHSSSTATALVVSIVTAYGISELARRAQDRSRQAQLRAQEAALRRVATLVAQGVSPESVFGAVTDEVGQLLNVDHAAMARYEPDGMASPVAVWNAAERPGDPGPRFTLIGRKAVDQPCEVGGPFRVARSAASSGFSTAYTRATGMRSSVSAPITVHGRNWGVMVAASESERALPPDAEERLGQFTELVSMAIANAQAQSELTASRARIVAAGDRARRRLERDLHDGLQQRLVSLALKLRGAHDAVPQALPQLQTSLAHIGDGLSDALTELQAISRGIHPAILSRGGLGPALDALVRRAATPTEISVRVDARLPDQIEIAAYYVVSEALANIAKHAQASNTIVSVGVDEGTLRIHVRDDGRGGADPDRGSGLIGLSDRVAALGGTISLLSPPGEGTSLSVGLPLEPAPGPSRSS